MQHKPRSPDPRAQDGGSSAARPEEALEIGRGSAGMCLADLEGRFLQVNPAFCRFLGYTERELLALTVADVTHPDDRPETLRELADAAACGRRVINLEKRYRRRDGTTVWGHATAFLSDPDGRPQRWMAVIQDRTAGKQAEEASRESEARYRSVIASLQEGIVIHGPDAVIRDCNASAERILGLSREQIIGRDPLDRRWRAVGEDGAPFPGESHPALVTLRTGRPGTGLVIGIHRPDGTLRWISISSQPLAGGGEDRPPGVVVSFADVTERKRAEQRLRAQYEVARILAEAPSFSAAEPRLLAALCEALTLGRGEVWRPAPDGSGLRRTAAWYRPWLAGSEPTSSGAERTLAPGQGLPGRVFATGRAEWTADVDADPGFIGGPSIPELRHAFAMPVRGRGGTEAVLAFFGREVREPDTDILLAMESAAAHMADFIDRRGAEEALRENQRRLAEAQEVARFGIWEWDVASGRVAWSDELFRIFGIGGEEFAGTYADYLARVHPEDRTRAMETVQGALRDRCAFELEERIVRPDGEVRTLHTEGEVRAHGAGQAVRMIGVCHDVTEQRRAEEALRVSEQKYRTLFESSKDAIFIVDNHGRPLQVNSAAVALFGYTHAEILARRARDFYTDPSAEARFVEAIGRDGSVQDFEVKLLRRDGAEIDCLVTATARRDDRGRVTRYEGIIRDVTAQRLAEWSLRNLSSHLLRLRDDERRKLARELHDSTGQELAGASLKLAAVLHKDRGLGAGVRQALQETLALVEQSAREIRTLSYLLHPPLLDEMGLASALRWLGDGFEARSGIRMTLELPDDVGRLAPELETTLFRIAQEALTNVHRHSGSPVAAVRIGREDGQVILEVRDEGRGMIAGSDHPVGGLKHLGVGIAGMRERVRQLGGWLDVLSGETGTTVRATLPLKKEG